MVWDNPNGIPMKNGIPQGKFAGEFNIYLSIFFSLFNDFRGLYVFFVQVRWRTDGQKMTRNDQKSQNRPNVVLGCNSLSRKNTRNLNIDLKSAKFSKKMLCQDFWY